jgi:hypothetical protein
MNRRSAKKAAQGSMEIVFIVQFRFKKVLKQMMRERILSVKRIESTLFFHEIVI